jgi:hypothetical protein
LLRPAAMIGAATWEVEVVSMQPGSPTLVSRTSAPMLNFASDPRRMTDGHRLRREVDATSTMRGTSSTSSMTGNDDGGTLDGELCGDRGTESRAPPVTPQLDQATCVGPQRGGGRR